MDLNLQFGIDSSAFALPTLSLDSVDDIFYGVTASPEHDERIEQYVLLNIPKDVQFWCHRDIDEPLQQIFPIFTSQQIVHFAAIIVPANLGRNLT